MDWGHHPAAPPGYDSPQRMQRAYLPPRAVGSSPVGRPPGKSNKSAGSPYKVSPSSPIKPQALSCLFMPAPPIPLPLGAPVLEVSSFYVEPSRGFFFFICQGCLPLRSFCIGT